VETLKLAGPLVTRDAVVLLDPKLPVGVYSVQLVVEGPTGKSAPAAVLIRVIKE